MKKLIIKEEQLNIIKHLILENKMNDIMSNAKIGDTVFIRYNNSNGKGFYKFEVVQFSNNGISMRLIEKKKSDKRDHLVIFDKEDLIGNDLKLGYIKKPEDTNKVEGEPGSLDINGVEQIVLLSQDNTPKVEFKPSEEAEEPEEDEVIDDTEEEPEEDEDVIQDTVNQFNKLVKGGKYVFILEDNNKINFNVLDINHGNFTIKIISTKDDRFKKLKDNTFEFNLKHDVKLSNNKDGFDITMDKISSDDNDSISIDNIIDIDERLESLDSDDVKDISKYATISPNDVVDILRTDPIVKSAFMKEPSFMDLILNRKPKGLARGADILNDLSRKGFNVKTKNLKDLFRVKEDISFIILDDDVSELVDGQMYRLKSGKRYNGQTSHWKNGKLIVKIDEKDNIRLLFKNIDRNNENIIFSDVYVINNSNNTTIGKNIKIKILE